MRLLKSELFASSVHKSEPFRASVWCLNQQTQETSVTIDSYFAREYSKELSNREKLEEQRKILPRRKNFLLRFKLLPRVCVQNDNLFYLAGKYTTGTSA
jgi:hypothetical protein